MYPKISESRLATNWYRVSILPLLSLCQFTQASAMSFWGLFLPTVRTDLGFNNFQAGYFTSAYFLGYTFGQIPWGYVADRIGGAKTIPMSVLGLSFGLLMSSTITSFETMLLWRVLSGLLGAGVFTSCVRVISGWYPGRTGTGIGSWSTLNTFGTIFVNAIMPIIATIGVGYWRWNPIVLATTGLIGGISVFFWVRDKPNPNVKEKVRIPLPEVLKRTIYQGSFWCLGFSHFVRLGITQGLGTFLNSFLIAQYGLTLVQAGLITSAITFTGFLNFINGYASDRVGEVTLAVSYFSIMGLAYLSLSSPLVLGLGIVLGVALVVAMRMSNSYLMTPTFAVVPKVYGTDITGMATSLQNVFASAGSFVFPAYIVGSAIDRGGYSLAWLIIAILAFLAVGVMVIFRQLTLKTLKKK